MDVVFIRLGPTTLFKAPSCYGNYNVRCDDRTGPCPVEHECIIGKAPEKLEKEEGQK